MSRPTMPALVQELLNYSLAYPAGSDSAEGIARWWLDTSGGIDMQALHEALDYLVSHGAYVELVGADGRRRFRRIASDAKLRELQALWAGAGRAGVPGMPRDRKDH